MRQVTIGTCGSHIVAADERSIPGRETIAPAGPSGEDTHHLDMCVGGCLSGPGLQSAPVECRRDRLSRKRCGYRRRNVGSLCRMGAASRLSVSDCPVGCHGPGFFGGFRRGERAGDGCRTSWCVRATPPRPGAGKVVRANRLCDGVAELRDGSTRYPTDARVDVLRARHPHTLEPCAGSACRRDNEIMVIRSGHHPDCRVDIDANYWYRPCPRVRDVAVARLSGDAIEDAWPSTSREISHWTRGSRNWPFGLCHSVAPKFVLPGAVVSHLP